MTDALDAVIDATLERALLADDARRYFALAGALERGRATARAGRAESPQPEHRDRDSGRPAPSENPTGPFGAALLSTIAVGALDAALDDDIDPGAWSPGNRAEPDVELVAAGAAAACRRFEVDPGTVATRSGLPVDRLARYRGDGDATTGSQ